jgi:hypothetical protein
MWQNYKADLRQIGKKDLSSELQSEVFGEINELTQGKLLDIKINPKDKTVLIKGKEGDIIKQETWDIKEYLKIARQYVNKTVTINKIRETYGIEDAYQYEELGHLIMKKSKSINRKVVDRGLENRLETLKKVLRKDKDTGEIPLIRAGKNLQEQLEIKYQAYENADDYINAAGEDVSKYKNKKGQFRSQKLRREYLKLFNEATDDQDFSWSEFAEYIFNNYIDQDSGITTRTFWKGLSKDEQVEIMKDYMEEKQQFNEMVDTSEGTIRAFKMKGGK